MLMVTAVFPANRSAFRTALRGIPCRNLQYFGTVLLRLVGKKLFQLIERPTPQVIVLFRSTGEIRCFETHARQILKHKQRILAIFLDECLRHPMVHIRHPTVLSSGKGFESTLCGFCSLSLKLFANLLKLVPFGRYLFPGNKVGFTLFIIADHIYITVP